MDYMKLQNGSDIRGIAYSGVPGEKINLGPEEAQRISGAFLQWLCKKTNCNISDLKISVGYDSRITSKDLSSAMISAMSKKGAQILDCGLASTPSMFMSTVFTDYNCNGAIMITASHLPFNRNGFKFFDANGGLEKKDIAWILSTAQAETVSCQHSAKKGEVIKMPLISRYSQHLREMIINEVASAQDYSHPLNGLKIMVDAGNGAGGFYAKEILEPLGADISSSQFLEPDGSFPNHIPNPENKEAMDSACAKVIESGADFGLIFDTDVDRAAAIDNMGRPISRNAIVAMAAALIAREHPGTTVVTDSITSDELTVYLEQCLGLKHLRYMRGYKNVINKSIELNSLGIDSQLAIETSGHAAYKENYFLDDGAYLATKIVINAAQLMLMGNNISCLIESLENPLEATEIRIPIACENFGNYGDSVIEGLTEWAKNYSSTQTNGLIDVSIVEPNYEGIRLNFIGPKVKGWCLLRKSLHDPLMPLNIETSLGSCPEILQLLKEYLLECSHLDLSVLE